MRKKNHKCLLIQTKDDRKFFTHEKNFSQLIEFANTFDARISVVQLEHGDILDLSLLAEAMSNPRYNKPNKFTLLENKIAPAGQRSAESVSVSGTDVYRQDAVSLRAYMKGRLESGEVVDIKNVAAHFPDFTTKSISAYLTKIKRDLTQRGNVITKLSTGRYRIQRRTQPQPFFKVNRTYEPYVHDREMQRESRMRRMYPDWPTVVRETDDVDE